MIEQFETEGVYFEDILKRAVKVDAKDLLKNVPEEDIIKAKKYMEKKLEDLFKNLKRN